MENLLTVNDISKLLKVKKRTIYQWTHLDFIPYVKIGRFVRFREKDVAKWLEKRQCNGRARVKVEVALER